jgi:uncharacterized protein DUF4136
MHHRFTKEICMKRIRSTSLCAVFFLVMVGASFAQHVQTDFDHQANFSQYKTYSWQGIKPPNSLWDARIKSAVDAQLAAKGWTQVDSGVDVAIVAIKTTQTQRTLQTFYDGFGGDGAGEDSGAGGLATPPPPKTTTKTERWLSTCTTERPSN